MAYYGIPSAGLALTASTSNDKVSVADLGGTLVTAQSVYGQEGNDIISLGAVGYTAVATNTGFITVGASAFSGNVVYSGEAQLVGSATYTNSATVTVLSGNAATETGFSVSVTGVLTSHQAIRTAVGAFFQANAGNDSIALGDSLATVSATTFAGGAGNDIIGSFTNVNDVWTGAAIAATVNASEFQAGKGADTIDLSGASTYSSLYVNGNQGNDLVSLDAVTTINKSTVGLGAGADTFSGQITTFTGSTLAGGKGNDTITLHVDSAENVIIGGDRANANPLDGDGADHIYIESGTVFTASTIYGGGGNDTVTFSADMTASTVSMGAGADIFTAVGGTIILDSTVGLGNGGDIFKSVGDNQILSSRINAAKGADSVYFVDNDIASGADYGSTTVYGGAGADYLLGSASVLTQDQTVAIELEYQTASESTLSAFDTIAVQVTDNVSAKYSFRYEPGATQASFSAAKATATNGVVTFSAGFDNNLTARAAYVADNTSAGNAAGFIDGDSKAYLFVKGSSDNLLVQVGSAAVSGVGAVDLNASKNIDLTILG